MIEKTHFKEEIYRKLQSTPLTDHYTMLTSCKLAKQNGVENAKCESILFKQSRIMGYILYIYS